MSTLTSSRRHPRIFICTHPRTASNLFIRLFENNPDLSIASYSFQDAFLLGPESLMGSYSAQRISQRGRLTPDATYQNGFNKLQKFIADAEAAGKIPFIKEHLYWITDPQIVAANSVCLPNETSRIL